MPEEYTDEDLLARWEDFFETMEYRSRLVEVSDHYPEQRSLHVAYSDLDRFDPDMANYLLQHPNKVLWNGEQVMKKLLPPSREGAEIHLRINELPRDSRVEIRKLRSKHLGKFISVEGLVRKATEVRPKITAALFQCMRCHAIIKEQQEGMFFKEPLECYKEQDGCGRSPGTTKFKLLTEDSRYVDTQKLEIQESPEGLRGGAQPERLVGYLEDDIAGKISPGDRVILNGVLRSVQKGAVAKSTLFDITLDIVSTEFQQHEYEEITIGEEDEQQILAESKRPDIFSKIIASISPSIYGYDVEKEALALQLFGGVPKEMDDGTRIRGDIHVLLVGDPGVAKCVTGDTEVMMADGSKRKIRSLVDKALKENGAEEIDDGYCADTDLSVLTFSSRGAVESGRAVRAWKRRAPERLIRVRTKGGRCVVVTPTHPFFVQNAAWITPRSVSRISVGTCIAVALGPGRCGPDEEAGLGRGLGWDQIESKEELPSRSKWVYDLEIEGTHNFVTNTIISHNSQLLRYMAELAPRGIYASGKGSSAAGLCVAPETTIEVDGVGVEIGEYVESRLSAPREVRKGVWRQEANGQTVASVSSSGRVEPRNLRTIWRIETPPFLVELEASNGQTIKLTPETRVMAMATGSASWTRAADVSQGDRLLVAGAGSGAVGEGAEPSWAEVVRKVLVTENLPSHVYDLTVDDSHAFVANGFLVHNTAAAVKDDFGEGRWTLEAGALVLADKGVAAVDELDKMDDHDRSAMHEAMESQTVTVAKAGITAMLQCRCSILGAANPKYGRFEEHGLIADQINLPPALLSRFDLIFAMTDKPDEDLDARITDHILKAHRRGQIRRHPDPTSLKGLSVDKIIEESGVMAPAFARDFLRKYVAYSKRFTPVLTDEAIKIIHDYYLKIRKQGEAEGSSVPITARQLEAFVRLSEASARARISELVTSEDANRAVRIVEYYLSKIAREAGRAGFDIDIITTGTSKSQREQITVLRRLISELADPRKGVAIEVLVQSAGEEGILEDRVRMLMRRLSTSGEVYSPSPGYYKLASEG